MVATGIIIGNHGKNFGMSRITTEYIYKFRELIDEILNAKLHLHSQFSLIWVKMPG